MKPGQTVSYNILVMFNLKRNKLNPYFRFDVYREIAVHELCSQICYFTLSCLDVFILCGRDLPKQCTIVCMDRLNGRNPRSWDIITFDKLTRSLWIDALWLTWLRLQDKNIYHWQFNVNELTSIYADAYLNCF